MKINEVVKDAEVRKRVRRNLKHWYAQSTSEDRYEGERWYSEASMFCQFLSEKYNVSKVVAAGVVSALSPNNKWGRNKIDAEIVLSAVSLGIDQSQVKVSTFNANKKRAFLIANGSQKMLKSSPKTYAFAKNIGDEDPNHVTIDRWHIRACQTTSKTPVQVKEHVTSKQYSVIEQETIKVANDLGLKPHQLQATVWVTIKNRWNR
jgi:hypothetical protein